MKQVAILGSTGSIGCNTLRVIDAFPEEFRVAALGAGGNVRLLADQIERYCPRVVSVADSTAAGELRGMLAERRVEIPPQIGVGVEG